MIYAEWLLVILAFLTLCTVAWQAWETRRAVEATAKSATAAEKSADATYLNARAFINSERAWVIAELVPICAKFGQWVRPVGNGGWATLSEEEILDGVHLRHKLKFTNMGRTPAHLLR